MYDASARSCGGPGARCGGSGDPSCCSGLSCYYNMCLAKASPPATSCGSVADCGGSCTEIVGCEGGMCCGKHSYPCGDPATDKTCCEGFHCFASGQGYNYCVEDDPCLNETECERKGYMLCAEIACNIGQKSCLAKPPKKDYTVPKGNICTFTGTIRNDGCAWINPATLKITGNNCSKTAIKYSDCAAKSFRFTCEAGDVHLSADDSSQLTLKYSCHNISLGCGNGVVDAGESCEPPSSNNNVGCQQSTSICNGMRKSVRDAYGYCSSTCGCIDDDYLYSCVKGECGASCSSNADCNDNNTLTRDTCTSTCVCTHDTLPGCGNGIVESGEECESNSQCDSDERCISCRCEATPYCGDGTQDSGEGCDYGVRINGVPCVPPTDGTCRYCNYNCSLTTLSGGGCGNSITEYGEECDDGSSNGGQCTPRCGDTCIYCTTQCKVGFVSGASCEGETTPYYYNNGYVLPVPYYGGHGEYYNKPRASVCGDGILGLGEKCDNGDSNGNMCKPACGSECSYCSNDCREVVLKASPCVRRARPWEPYQTSFCSNLTLAPDYARLDQSCGGNSLDVRKEVNASDNIYAQQASCAMDGNYIYLQWHDVKKISGLKQIAVLLEHREEASYIKIEHYNGTGWDSICDVPASSWDVINSCALSTVYDFSNISVRVRIIRSGAQAAYENLDGAALMLAYCRDSASACGNGMREGDEECDDGNTFSGDGCSMLCTLEVQYCGEWSACVDGKQSQVCAYGDAVINNVRGCSGLSSGFFLWLLMIIIMILLLLLFLFFPLIFLFFKKRKKKKSEHKR